MVLKEKEMRGGEIKQLDFSIQEEIQRQIWNCSIGF